jgi:hypothetical protein
LLLEEAQVEARERLAREPTLLDEALETLEERRGSEVDEAVIAAIRCRFGHGFHRNRQAVVQAAS